MKKKNKNLQALDDPHLRALWLLAGVPHHCWDLSMIVACDLEVRGQMPSMQPLSNEDVPDLDEILNECRELRR